MSLTKAQTTRLCTLIDLHVDAHCDAAFAGTKPKDEAVELRAAADLAKAKLSKYIHSLAETVRVKKQ